MGLPRPNESPHESSGDGAWRSLLVCGAGSCEADAGRAAHPAALGGAAGALALVGDGAAWTAMLAAASSHAPGMKRGIVTMHLLAMCWRHCAAVHCPRLDQVWAVTFFTMVPAVHHAGAADQELSSHGCLRLPSSRHGLPRPACGAAARLGGRTRRLSWIGCPTRHSARADGALRAGVSIAP
jgi:hypothetical protein